MNDKKFQSLFNLRANKGPPVKCKWHKFRNMERALKENEWIRAFIVTQTNKDDLIQL